MATADISQIGRSIWANTDFDRGLEKVAVLQDFLEDNVDDLAAYGLEVATKQAQRRRRYSALVSLGVLPVQRLKADVKLACVEKPSKKASSCNLTLPSSR